MKPDAVPRDPPLIGVLSALRPEVSILARGLTSPRKTRVEGRAAWRGKLGGAPLLVLPGGMGPRKSAASARALVEQGVSSLFCVGAAGALTESLEVGDLVLAEWVLEAGGGRDAAPCDGAWIERARALAARTGVRLAAGGVVSVPEPAATPEAKARLAALTGALAADMESAAAAAQASGVAFLALRVITDDARTGLPDLRDGWRRPGRLLREGAGFLARAGAMRRALRGLQDFLRLLLMERPPPGGQDGPAASRGGHG